MIVPYAYLFDIRETSEISKNRDCPGILRRYDQEDFDLLAFTRVGATWERVDRDFEGTLEQVLATINEAMAT